MAYEIPYDSDYEYWYGIPQNVTRLSATLQQTTNEDSIGIGRITASWDVPDNGGTFVAQISTDGEIFTIAESNIRKNSVTLTVSPNTDYYVKIVTVLGGNQSEGTVSDLLIANNIPTPNTPTVTVTPSGLRIDVGIIPQGYRANIAINNGEEVDYIDTSNLVYMYLCNAGDYSVSVAFMDVNGNIGTYSSSVTVTTKDVNIYNLKTPLIDGYRLIGTVSDDYYANTKDMVILQVSNRQYSKDNALPAICGYYRDGSNWIVPFLMSLVPDAVKMYRDNHYNVESYDGIYYDSIRGVNWYYNSYSSSLLSWDNIGSITVNPPLIGNGEQISVTTACRLLLEDAQPIVEIVDADSIEENLFYPPNVSLSSGDTIADDTLKSLIAFHRPITINGTVYIPYEYVNDTYVYYALHNGTNTEIKKATINSSWTITITTESSGGGYVLPIASLSTLGGIKVGNNLSIDANGVLSATGGGGGGDVTTNTDQNITGTKTFVGQKKILFKQASSTDKLGFTLYTDSNSEKGFLEYNPQNLIDNVPLFTIGNHADDSGNLAHIGFRKLSRVSGASGAYNLLTPLIADARTPFNLTTNYTTFYLPLGVTNGVTMVKTDKRGVLDISTLFPTLPIASANTLGGIKVGNGLSIDVNGVLSATGGGGGGSYAAGDGIDITNNVISLDIASSNNIGGIKVGTNLSIDANGVLSAKDTTYSVFVGSGASASSGLVPAPPTTEGTTKFLREDGSWSVPSGGGGSYSAGDGIDITNDVISLEKASANGLGGIKVGSGLSIDNDGVLSATGGGGGGFSQILIYSGNWVGGQITLTESIENFDDFAIIYNNGSRSDLAWAVTTFVIKDILASSTSSSPVSFYGEASRKFSFYKVDNTHLAMESRDTYGIKRIYGRKY